MGAGAARMRRDQTMADTTLYFEDVTEGDEARRSPTS